MYSSLSDCYLPESGLYLWSGMILQRNIRDAGLSDISSNYTICSFV